MTNSTLSFITEKNNKKLSEYFERDFKSTQLQNNFKSNKKKQQKKKKNETGFRNKRPPSIFLPHQLEKETEQEEKEQSFELTPLSLFASAKGEMSAKSFEFFDGTPVAFHPTASTKSQNQSTSIYKEVSPIENLFPNLSGEMKSSEQQGSGDWFTSEFNDLISPKCINPRVKPETKLGKTFDAMSPSSFFSHQIQESLEEKQQPFNAFASSSVPLQFELPASFVPTNLFPNVKQEQEQQQQHVQFDYMYGNMTSILPTYSNAPQQQQQQVNVVQKKIKKVQKKIKSELVLTDIERKWKLISKNDLLSDIKCSDLVIQSKTRREAWSDFLPDRMYSSLKYEIKLTACGKSLLSKPFLIARMVVLNAETLKEEKKDGKDVLTLKPEGALTVSDDKTHLTCSLKIQFVNGLSYHQEKREFICEIRYYDRQDIKNPILIKRSSSFRIYARKPNSSSKKKNVTKKRKLDKQSKTTTNASKNKKLKIEHFQQQQQKESNMDQFLSRLDELVKVNLKLNESEKQFAMNVVLKRLLHLKGGDQFQQTQQTQGINNLFPSEESNTPTMLIDNSLFYGN